MRSLQNRALLMVVETLKLTILRKTSRIFSLILLENLEYFHLKTIKKGKVLINKQNANAKGKALVPEKCYFCSDSQIDVLQTNIDFSISYFRQNI